MSGGMWSIPQYQDLHEDEELVGGLVKGSLHLEDLYSILTVVLGEKGLMVYLRNIYPIASHRQLSHMQADFAA